MKIALYIEDGLEQVVLTPDSETERAILGKLHDGTRTLAIHKGAFYGCAGGWIRFKVTEPYYRDPEDESTIIVLREAKEMPASSVGSEHMEGER